MHTLTSQRDEGGFTLVEVVVVIAVVALLAAIMTPLIAKNIDDAKVGRAENEITVIAAALGNFYKDVGRWPSMNASGAFSGISVLVSGNSTNTGYAISGGGWITDATTATVDYLDNHLLTNAPKGTAAYNASGRNSWRGPYLDSAPLDPWGQPYLVNIIATDASNGVNYKKGFVVSAGADGVLNTTMNTTRTSLPAGDDIAVSFFVR